jgi:hypothetical protein
MEAAISRQLSAGTSYFIPSRSQTGGTGVSPVLAQAKACGYQKQLFECKSVSKPHSANNCHSERRAESGLSNNLDYSLALRVTEKLGFAIASRNFLSPQGGRGLS